MEEWTDSELRSAVDAYLGYLADERSGKSPSKAALREEMLASSLSARTAGSYEYRMQNISAVLASMGRAWIHGYKPAANVGATNSRKIRQLIEAHDGSAGAARVPSRIEPHHVYVANFGRENFEWPNCRAGNYVATMQDERVHEHWLSNNREAYIELAIANLKTAKGLPPTRPVASRWFNLGSIIAQSEGDLWLHKQDDVLWWTVTTTDPVRLEREPDPSARPGDPQMGIFYRKPAQPWSNQTLRGNRLEWRALHPKTHDFFTTEATLQRLGDEYAGYAVALINGDDVSAWTEQKEWKDKVAARNGNSGGKVFSRRERTIASMARRAIQTARAANGQQQLRRAKNKEVRFTSQREFEAYIDALWESQEGLCALSGLELQCEPADDPEFCASLDRIDSAGHYEAGNLQVVCRFINRWKSDDSASNFQRLLSVVQGAITGTVGGG